MKQISLKPSCMDPSSEKLENRLVELMDELHHMAKKLLANESSAFSLSPSEVVQECLLPLVKNPEPLTWSNKSRTFGYLHTAMVHLLRRRGKRRKLKNLKFAEYKKNRIEQLDLDEIRNDLDRYPHIADALNEELEILKTTHPKHATMIYHRFFGGLKQEDIASLMGVSKGTIRSWARQCRVELRDRINQRLERMGH